MNAGKGRQVKEGYDLPQMKTIFHQLAYLFTGHISSTTGKDNSTNYFHKFMHENFDTFLWFSYSISFWWHSSLTNSRTFRLIYIFFCAKKNLHQIILYQIQTHYDLASHLADISCDDNSISRFWLKYNPCAASVGGDRSSSLGELCLRSCSPYPFPHDGGDPTTVLYSLNHNTYTRFGYALCDFIMSFRADSRFAPS